MKLAKTIFLLTLMACASCSRESASRLVDNILVSKAFSFPTPNGAVTDVAWTHDGQRALISTQNGDVDLWNMATQTRITQFKVPGIAFNRIDISADDRFAALAGMKNTVALIDLTTLKVIRQFSAPGDADFYAVRFSSDGKLLVTGSSDTFVRIWDLSSGTIVATLSGHEWPVQDVMFMSQGAQNNAFVLSADPQSIRLWNIESQTLVRTLIDTSAAPIAGVAWMNHMDFSPDGKFVLAGSDKTMVLFDLATAQVIASYTGNAKEILEVRFDPHRKFVMSAGADLSIRMWDLESGAPLSTVAALDWSGVGAMALDPAGQRFIFGCFTWDIFGGIMQPSLSLWNLTHP